LQKRGVEKSNGAQMQYNNDLPQPFWISDQPGVVFDISRPVQGRDPIVERPVTKAAINQSPKVIDEKLTRPAGQRVFERFLGTN